MSLMANEPMFEIWGAYLSSDETSPATFLEDCYTIDEARKARDEWQSNPDQAAWIHDKDTGKVVQ